MNEEYILSEITPYLNDKREISESEFIEIFHMLTRKEQYEVIGIMIANDIEYVDFKETSETKQLEIELSSKTVAVPTGLKAYQIKMTNEELCVLYQQGDQSALEKLLIKNERFVFEIVFKSQKGYNHSLEIDDLLQFGKMGLMRAAKDFEVTQGFSFLTYEWHWIKQAVTRGLMDTGYSIRIPVHYFEWIAKVSKMQKTYLDLDAKDMMKVICSNLEITDEKYNEILFIKEKILMVSSLNVLVGENSDTELMEFVSDNYGENNENMLEIEVEQKILGESLEEALNTLTKREAEVLRLRFGFGGEQVHTLEEIGVKFKLTRERIRQIESKALRKLRHPSRSKKLKDFL